MSATTSRRFKVNPVEVAIFSVVSLIFLNSVYNLFYDQSGFQPTALAPMAANPISEGRAPASVSQRVANVEFKCDVATYPDTQAQRIKLVGSLCGVSSGKDASKEIKKTQVTNLATAYEATVFTDETRATFSTDYIELNLGKNPIRVEFLFQDGKKVVQEISINKL